MLMRRNTSIDMLFLLNMGVLPYYQYKILWKLMAYLPLLYFQYSYNHKPIILHPTFPNII